MSINYGGTIAAIATAPGAGGIGVIRISGEDAYEVAKRVFVPADKYDILTADGYTMKFGKIVSEGETIDEAIALFFRAPKSYTAEDVVELQCHGGSVVSKLVLRAVLNAGARMAMPGEFTRRAFENGRLSLTEAEAVMDIINADSEHAAAQATAAMQGRTGREITTVVSNLTAAAAALNVWADFPEDDVPPVDVTELDDRLAESEKKLSAILASSEVGIKSRNGIKTVIAGRPNVGKSSLMNMLAGCERCIVTDIPGTTRDVVEEKIDLGGTVLALSDTAGLRESSDRVEMIGINEAKKRIDSAELVLAVFDSSQPLTDEDKDLIASLGGKNAVAVINKTDKPSQIDTETILSTLKTAVYISAKEKTGFEELKKAIEDVIGKSKVDAGMDILANERQLAAAKNALSEIKLASSALSMGMTLDAVTINIESAIDYLLELTGERVSEKVVDEIFANFCVGK